MTPPRDTTLVGSNNTHPSDLGCWERWEYPFRWTHDHMSKEELDRMRGSHDELGSSAYEKLKGIIDVTGSSGKTANASNYHTLDLYAVLRDHHDEDPTLQALWYELHAIPEWVDWRQIEHGQTFFARYAIFGVHEVFSRTHGFTMKNFLPRFIETFAWLTRVTNSLKSIQPGGDGHTDSVRVRLIHASVRQRIMNLAATRPTYFNIQEHGPPINDYSSMHTISLFCASPMWDALPRIGIKPSKQEQEDYVALFRYVAYLIGVPNERFETSQKAKATMESFLLAEAEPNAILKNLVDEFVQWVEVQPPVFLSRGFLIAGFYRLNGARYCKTLGYARPSIYHRISFRGFCLLAYLLSVAQWILPPVDRFMVQFFRTKLISFLAQRAGLIGSYNASSMKFERETSTSTPPKATKGLKGSLELGFFAVYVIFVLTNCLLAVGVPVAILFFLLKYGYPSTWISL
ncbi:uncharacterized protein PAC_20058 [Phialocephala subalpina]|uniref:ER-bound oxygenase mpaB/mpaB'/Rubber oxygenase catalytic domain-containing protein n=1 Tax=Phialocephala subalpina TaxID=576137 RepID=A0A1L7XYQ8_9HELO|nr:uncharacterized protein PAC_20058 [Phialocephala subalpina]